MSNEIKEQNTRTTSGGAGATAVETPAEQEVDQAQLDPGTTVKTGDIVEGKVVKIEDSEVLWILAINMTALSRSVNYPLFIWKMPQTAVELNQTVTVKVDQH